MVSKIVLSVSGFLFIMLVMVACSAVLEGVPCKLRASKMNHDYSWGPFTGCMVQVRGQWVPIENYKVVE